MGDSAEHDYPREFSNDVTTEIEHPTNVPPGKESVERKNALQMFWYEGKLSWIAELSIRSFTRFPGTTIDVYSYEKECDPHIPGCNWMNAQEILPENVLSRYKDNRGYAIASDLFRYRLLYVKGGWYFDTDCLLLRPLTPFFDRDYVFARQDANAVNNGVMKFPAGDPMLSRMYKECVRIGPEKHKYGLLGIVGGRIPRVRRYFLIGWAEFGPSMLTRHLMETGLISHALPPESFYPIHWTNIKAFRSPFVPSQGTYILHLWSEMLRRENWKITDLDKSLLETAGTREG